MSDETNDDKSTSLSDRAINRRSILLGGTTLAAASAIGATAPVKLAQAQQPASSGQPNILVIMGDDIGWANIGVYNQGIMAGRTPHLDRMANEGMRKKSQTKVRCRPVRRRILSTTWKPSMTSFATRH
jgi:hypothetical protein